jgi:hypothetical protein
MLREERLRPEPGRTPGSRATPQLVSRRPTPLSSGPPGIVGGCGWGSGVGAVAGVAPRVPGRAGGVVQLRPAVTPPSMFQGWGTNRPAALTSKVASACSSVSCRQTRSAWSRSARSAVIPQALPSLAKAVTVSSTLAGSCGQALPPPDQGPPAGGLPGGPQLPTGPLREPLDPHRLANLGTSSVSPRRSSGHIPPGSAPVHVQTTPVASATSAGPEADNAAPAVCSHHGEPPSASPASGNPRLPASVLSC